MNDHQYASADVEEKEVTSLATASAAEGPDGDNGKKQGAMVRPTMMDIFRGLSWTDRLLPLLILICIIGGALIGNYVEGASATLNSIQVTDVPLPLFIGLLVMMYPVLCKVRYESVGTILRQRAFWQQLSISFGINWVIGPFIMLALAWATLPDLDEYRTGVVLIGIARCIAMVFIWNDLAGGDSEYCALLVAFNSLLQMVLYAPLALFFVKVLSNGDDAQDFSIGYWVICRSVLLFLGIPLGAAIITRLVIRNLLRKPKWYDERFMPVISPLALAGLLFTIVIMFISQGGALVDKIGSVFRTCVPLFLYFPIMFFATFYLCYRLGFDYSLCVTQAFTAASNNFELAIAVAVATFGLDSNESLGAVVGPLMEVPILLLLVYFCLWWKVRLFNPYTGLSWKSEAKSAQGQP
ncbi:arsenicals resistance [Dimargaris verticillata]|uniref:Arsenicals resistance n=1 Tax=Dimargaris verticillata TaxID=2761393 RepID=A0A9W8E8G0_9FUNG|nr:arsenicals resistance [Dimargaris verticillata]